MTKIISYLQLMFIVLFCSTLTFISCFSTYKKYSISSVKNDSFYYYYKMLDSISNRNPYESSAKCINAIRYMERISGLKAHLDGNYIGWFSFTKGDLIEWEKWYKTKLNN